MIPKIIHYIWFGRKEMPTLDAQCVRSWRWHHPDYDIRRWTEDDVPPVILHHPYFRTALENGKFSNASDIMRFWIIWKHGGIYLDTDVETVAPLDSYLKYDVVGSFWNIGEKYSHNCINCAIMMGYSGNPVHHHALNEFFKNKFFAKSVEWATRGPRGPLFFTRAFREQGGFGKEVRPGSVISNNYIGSRDEFYPFHWTEMDGLSFGELYHKQKPETVTLHYWNGSGR